MVKDKIVGLLGRFFHKKGYKKIKRNLIGKNNQGIILMSGPSNEKDSFYNKTFDVAATSNLMQPKLFEKKVCANTYFHFFSDPSIISNPEKFQIFLDIYNYSKSKDNYYLVVPFNYIKKLRMVNIIFSKNVCIYNADLVYRSNLGFKLDKFCFPNMNTILLDSTLPWLAFLGTKNIEVSGFDAFYGTGNDKSYSSNTYNIKEKNIVESEWGKEVKDNAIVMTQLLHRLTDSSICYSKNSGFYKYIKDKHLETILEK